MLFQQLTHDLIQSSALSLRLFGEDITTEAREVSRKKQEKEAAGDSATMDGLKVEA